MRVAATIALLLTVIFSHAQIGAKVQQASKITGTWYNNQFGYQMTLILNPDGSGEFDGEAIKYVAKGTQFTMTIVNDRETINYNHNLQGNSLTVSGGDLDQPVTFTRAGSEGQQQNNNGAVTAPTQSNTGGNGSVAMELVGKWCWVNTNTYNSGGSSSSQCIVLNADGTYEYTSESSRGVNADTFSGGTNSQGYDRGTWSVQGDRIFYNSQTKGQGSYRLEKKNHPKNVNDPMIVLDGEPFVTQYQKAPWR